MKKLTYILSVAVILILAGCAAPQDKEMTNVSQTENQKTTETSTVAADPDTDHGCVESEGYVWCEEGNMCVKTDEKCEKSSNGPKRSYDLISEAYAKKNNLTTGDFSLGINSLTLTHFRGQITGKEGVILAKKHNNDWEIVFDGAYGKDKNYMCTDTKDFPPDMTKDCIN